MADYDVGVVGLSVPPAAAVKTTYRPAVLVRNNGLHDALASGYIRIYKAGLMVFESELYSPTIDPGENSLAQAVDYWTPDIGTYMVCGYVTCPLDQVEPNNNLAPVTVVVGEGPIPPTPPVTLHASQHEEGGADEVSIDGLPGRARDPQVPYDHVSNHEPGGSDVLDVTGLHGELADKQPPGEHGNEAHTTPFATVLQVGDLISVHNAGITQHAAATNLEKTANKGAANGYAPLDDDIKVPAANLGGDTGPTLGYLNSDREWDSDPEVQPNKGQASGYAGLDANALVPPAQLGTGTAHQNAFLRGDQSFSRAPVRRAGNLTDLPLWVERAETKTLVDATFPPGYFSDDAASIRFRARFKIRASVPCHANIHLDKNFSGAPGWGTMCDLELTALMPAYPDYQYVDVEGVLELGTWSLTERKLVGHARALQSPAAASAGIPAFVDAIEPVNALTLVADDTIQVRMQLILPDVPDVLAFCYSATIDVCGGPNP